MINKRAAVGSESGGALVELAVALPLLILIFAGTADFARAFYTAMSLTDAARAGAQYGSYNAAQSGNTATMQSTATSATGLSGVTATASRSCQCASDTGTFSATSPTVNDCSNSCPGGRLVITVTVTTTKLFTTIMGGLPGFLNSLTLSRTATLRAMQ